MAVRLVDRNWGYELAAAAAAHPSKTRIICPYIKAAAIDKVLGAAATAGIDVITRFSLADFGAGVSDIAALRKLIAAGARIRGVRGLHAKVFVFGDGCAAVTSANLTTAGLTRNEEFGCISEDRDFIVACQTYFEELWSRAGENLVAKTLDDWDSLVETFLSTGGSKRTESALPDLGTGTLSGSPLSRGLQTAPSGWVAESDTTWVKLFGEGHNRASWSLATLDEVRRSGSHWAGAYPTGRRPRSVRDGDTLFMGRLVRDPNDIVIYGRAIGMAHVPARDDASPAEMALRAWKSQWSHYVRVHHAEFIAGALRNGVPLSALMDTLGPEAFATTQQNAQRGSGNLNPRAALRQQPAVRLSADGAAWLNHRFGQALTISGALAEDDLSSLDWPSSVSRVTNHRTQV